MTETLTAPTAGERIAELWDAERCTWHIEYHGSRWSPTTDPYVVLLEWTQESGNEHHADWVTWTWQFYGSSAEEAMTEALRFCEELAPWAPCGECDGRGAWNGQPCPTCATTGLASGGEDR